MKLKSLSVPEGVSSQLTHPHTTVQALHKELLQKKAIYEARIAEMSAEIKRLKKPRQKELVGVTNQSVVENTTEAVGGRPSGQEELVQLKREYQQMRRERDSLAQELDQLQGQLSERKVGGNNPFELEAQLENMAKERSALEQQVCTSEQVGVAHVCVGACTSECVCTCKRCV